MIINHKYKFIFVKTRKTASTSLEIALSELCDTNDIITPIYKDDEVYRSRGPQNYLKPFDWRVVSDWIKILKRKRRSRLFWNHISASKIKKIIGKDIWQEYFTFCFERNPYVKAISRYYWNTRNVVEKPSFNEFMKTVSPQHITNWPIYTIENSIAVDFIGRYEYLEQDFESVIHKLGVNSVPVLPKAKSGYRQNVKDYHQIIDKESKKIIDTFCKNELNYLNYSW